MSGHIYYINFSHGTCKKWTQQQLSYGHTGDRERLSTFTSLNKILCSFPIVKLSLVLVDYLISNTDLYALFHFILQLFFSLDITLLHFLDPITGPHCFLEQETLPLLLSTVCFQERIRA